MRTAHELYDAYRIMPALQNHQLRVAAVGKFIAERSEKPVDEESIILAGLFHDMGNIIKFDLSYYPELLEPKGLEYWQGVKEDFTARYGKDHHKANTAIAREIALPESVVAIIDMIGFSNVPKIVASGSPELKIVEYADSRVGPFGVLPLEERLADGRKRYLNRSKDSAYGIAAPKEEFERLMDAERELERQVIESSMIQSEDISDVAVAPLIEQLRKYAV